LYAAFVWARRALNRPNLRFPARAVYPFCHGCRTPTLREQRSMAWQAVVRGANGIFFFPDWKSDPSGR
jgi:hypothetical protein